MKRSPVAAREVEEAPKKSGGFFGFGAAKAAEVEEDSDEEEDEPKSGGFFGFGARCVAFKVSAYTARLEWFVSPAGSQH